MMKKLTQQGDTIIEVLVVIAIVALVLGGAYASARRSFITTQQTQERSEAAKYSEEQLERLRVAADDPDNAIFGSAGSSAFCLISTGETRTAGSAPCGVGTDNRYKLSITRTQATVNGGTHYTFRVRTTWDLVGANDIRDTDEINMYYRIHPKL
jgi:prepilin-type N-terminal cleavage/methylation domain-containing protein